MKVLISPNGYYYKEDKNGKKKRISMKEYNKLNKNLNIIGGDTSSMNKARKIKLKSDIKTLLGENFKSLKGFYQENKSNYSDDDFLNELINDINSGQMPFNLNIYPELKKKIMIHNLNDLYLVTVKTHLTKDLYPVVNNPSNFKEDTYFNSNIKKKIWNEKFKSKVLHKKSYDFNLGLYFTCTNKQSIKKEIISTIDFLPSLKSHKVIYAYVFHAKSLLDYLISKLNKNIPNKQSYNSYLSNYLYFNPYFHQGKINHNSIFYDKNLVKFLTNITEEGGEIILRDTINLDELKQNDIEYEVFEYNSTKNLSKVNI